MKEKIKQLLAENYEYELPRIFLSRESIELTVEAGTSCMGSFTIHNSENRDMRGILYCNHPNMKITNPMFIGSASEIQYVFQGRRLKPGQTEKGRISILSSLGEMSVGFEAKVVKPFASTSLGEIKDLFHFANLAKTDWEEAICLFESREFERIFLKEEKHLNLYKSLMKGNSSQLAMEEFLIAIQKKNKIRISLDKSHMELSGDESSFMEELLLTKDTWGYKKLSISASAPFLTIEKKEITTNDFIGNTYHLNYIVDCRNLKPGNHYGRITVDGGDCCLSADIKLMLGTQEEKEEREKRRKEKEVQACLIRNYLDFRTGKIAHEEYVSRLCERLGELEAYASRFLCLLWKTHYYIISYSIRADETLKELLDSQEELKNESVIYYCAFLYLNALHSKKKEEIEKASQMIRTYYEDGKKDFRLLWFLLYLDEEYDSNPDKKWTDIMELLNHGTTSPVIYFEALSVLKTHISYIKSPSPFVLRVMHWAAREGNLTAELAESYCLLLEQEKKIPFFAVGNLMDLYEKWKSRELLLCICRLLIESEKKDTKYHKWFRRGEEKQLRLELLYEYYLFTMEENYKEKLPASIFVAFAYDNKLGWEKEAFLYAYIIRNKNKDIGNYLNYHKKMERFAIEQIRKERIDKNLAVIYKEFIDPDQVDVSLGISLAKIMFCHELLCTSPFMKGVLISHKELNKEVYYPLTCGRAVADIFTESPVIVFVDREGNRYGAQENYTATRLLHIHGLAKRCYECCKTHPSLLLHLFEKIDKYQKNDEHSIYVQRRCVNLPGFKDCYKGRVFEKLIEYYFDSMEQEALKSILQIADMEIMRDEFRPKMIHYCIIYDLEEKAAFGLKEYGFHGIPLNRLIKFSTDWMEKQGMEIKSEFMLRLCDYIFGEEKYNEQILQYLMLHFEGPTKRMKKIWKCAKDFELDTYKLEEKILSQALFGESYGTKVFDVFSSYYKKGGDEKLISAYLSYSAYKYLVKDCMVEEEIFWIIEKEQFCSHSKAGLLALIKYYSEKEILKEEEASFCQIWIKYLFDQGLIFPFYKKFEGRLLLPQEVYSHYYIEYKCNPSHKAAIHYRMEDDRSQEEFITEDMENMYLGIHVKPFLLFQDESLQYYITENDGVREHITESVKPDLASISDSGTESMFGLLNLMITAKEMKDEKTLTELMEQMIIMKHAGKKLFKIL